MSAWLTRPERIPSYFADNIDPETASRDRASASNAVRRTVQMVSLYVAQPLRRFFLMLQGHRSDNVSAW